MTFGLPSGRASQRAVVERPKSVVIIPVTTEGEVLLIRQYRYAVDQYLIELPAGLIDPGEDALATAARELAEEAGYEPSTMRVLTTVYMSPGYTDEQTTYVLAEGCRPVTTSRTRTSRSGSRKSRWPKSPACWCRARPR